MHFQVSGDADETVFVFGFRRVTAYSLASQLKPDKVYYVGGFGVLSKWLPVSEYEVSIGFVLKSAPVYTVV